MSRVDKGTFEIEFTPSPPFDTAEGAKLARTSGTKKFEGDLEGTSSVEMLSAVTETKGSAGYVALERVNGTLQGGKGTFVLQHSGIMNRGQGQLTVVVVPDSGTGELREISGRLQIEI